MTTLDNINENILIKIDVIEKLSSILIDKFNLFDIQKKTKNNLLNKNIQMLKNKYEDVVEKINIYEIKSIIYLTEYYFIINNNQMLDNNTNKKNIYNDSIFLIDSDNETILSLVDIMELKQIYYSNYYQYKKFNNVIKKTNKNNLLNKKQSKNIYNKFNIFISSNDIYGTFDNYIDYISCFIDVYKNTIIDLNAQYYKNITVLKDSDKYFKRISTFIENFNKTKLIYSIDEIKYDVCSCGQKMIIQADASELLCIRCGYIKTLIGTVFLDSQFFNQEGNRYKHGSYDPNRHCKFWIERIQAKENTIIEQSFIDKIEKCIKKDRIENLKNISVKQFRMYLKQTDLTKLNDHIPLIKKMITGYIPPQLTHNELHLLFNYFDKATKTYESIKPNTKKNSLYYPFLIYKILELIIDEESRKNGLLSCIHLQSYKTLIDNDKIWKSICENNACFEFIPTNKIDLY